MTKGNWERRAELAAARRIQHKEEKAARRQPKISGEGVWPRLLKDESLNSSGANVLVWLECPTQVDVCRSWFRTEICENRKCKLLHLPHTIGHVRGVVDDADNVIHTPIKQCRDAASLSSVSQGDSLRIRFVSVDNNCVFDFEHPEVWEEWAASRQECLKVQPLSLGVISESDEHDFQSLRDAPKEKDDQIPVQLLSDLTVGDTAHLVVELSSSCSSFYNLVCSEDVIASAEMCVSMAHMSVFLENRDIFPFIHCNKNVKRALLRHEIYRRRYKECHSLILLNQSKHRKEEKKIKAKQANAAKKTSKKDAFARGGNN